MDKSRNDYILLFVKGIGVGAVEVIPGASGAAVAFITGVYDELVHSLKAIDLEALKLLFKFRTADFWKKINGNFLAALGGGIVFSLFSFARLINYFFDHHSILIWSFFIGIVSISGLLVLRRIRTWDISVALCLLVGAGAGYALTVLTPLQSSPNMGLIFLAGVVGVGATLIPGISGIFVLILLGQYQFLVNALLEFNVLAILLFGIGGLAAIAGFSRFLSWILDNYHGATVALLAGFMLGSLNKVWPWREALEFVTNRSGKQVPVFDQSILPWNYLATTGKDPQVFQAVLMMALGVFIVVLIEKIAARLKTKI